MAVQKQRQQRPSSTTAVSSAAPSSPTSSIALTTTIGCLGCGLWLATAATRSSYPWSSSSSSTIPAEDPTSTRTVVHHPDRRHRMPNRTRTMTSTTTTSPCRTYLAPSTIPGAGLGMFAGIDFDTGAEVTPGDAVVPLIDVDWNNYHNKKSNTFLWDDYIWSGSTFPGVEEPFVMDADGASFGIGAIPNCHFGLINVEETVVHMDSSSTACSGDTPYHHRQGVATQPIQQGAEIFVDYGYGYFEGTRATTIGPIPFVDDFAAADRVIGQFRNVILATGTEQKDKARAEDLYTTMKDIIGTWPESRVAMALPNDLEHMEQLAGRTTAHKDYKVRTVEELEIQGTCLDHVRAEPSEHGSGRGAFAARDLPRGSVVAPVPLIHLPERKVLNMYAWGLIDPDDGDPFWGEPVSEQLLLNYCWGHPATTLLLCPYGVVSSLINHAPGEQANVQVTWSQKSTTHAEWWDQPISEWAYTNGSGLSFEYIATRDIAAGEEVLVDYGPAWQAAWDAHQERFNVPTERLRDRLNSNWESSLVPIEWPYSQGDPLENPGAVSLWCYSAYREIQGLPWADDPAYPCKVILHHGDDKETTYTVEIVARLQNSKGEESNTKQCFEIFDEVLWGVPRDALAYGGPFAVEDAREFMSSDAFRHEMRIPDHLLPTAWRNVRPVAASGDQK